MSDYQGDIIKGKKTRETGEDTGFKAVVPDTVGIDDSTLLSRLVDTRPDTIRLQQQREISLSTVDSSTFYAIMDGDETAVRGRLGGATRDLSDTALNLLVKARQKSDEKDYAETVLGRMLAQQNDDDDRRPGGMLSRFRWYFVFSPDVNEQLDDTSDKKRAHKAMLNTYLGLAVGATIADRYGGFYDPVNNTYHDRFGGHYDSTGYISAAGDILFANGGMIDKAMNAFIAEDGSSYAFSEAVRGVDRKVLRREMSESAQARHYDENDQEYIDHDSYNDFIDSLVNQQLGLVTEENEETMLEEALHRAQQAAAQEGIVQAPPAASAMASSPASAAQASRSVMQSPEFQRIANETPGGALALLHDPESGIVTIRDAKHIDTLVQKLSQEGRDLESLSPAEKLLMALKGTIDDSNAAKLPIESDKKLSPKEKRARVMEINSEFSKELKAVLTHYSENFNVQVGPMELLTIIERLGAGTGLASNVAGSENLQKYIKSEAGAGGHYARRAQRIPKHKLKQCPKICWKHLASEETGALEEASKVTIEPTVTIEMLEKAIAKNSMFLEGRIRRLAHEIEGITGISDRFGHVAEKNSPTIDASRIMKLSAETAEQPTVRQLLKRGLPLMPKPPS